MYIWYTNFIGTEKLMLKIFFIYEYFREGHYPFYNFYSKLVNLILLNHEFFLKLYLQLPSIFKFLLNLY
jgi:hypothetical protein